jgi:hypothetical protein
MERTIQEQKAIEQIVQRLLNNIKTEGVNDFDNICYHRSWYLKEN